MSNFDSYMDTSASDTTFRQDTLFDTVTRAEKALFAPDMFPIVDTFLTQNYKTNLIDTTFQIVKSTTLRKSPVFKSHNQWTKDYSWNAGISLSTILYGMFPIHIFNFTGLRHILTPSVGINLSNEFQGKLSDKPATEGAKPVETKFQILSASLSTGYDFEAPKRKWSASVSPSYTFSQTRATPLDPFVTTKNYSLSTSAGFNFTRNWSMSWSSTYNFVSNQFVDHDIHFHFSQDCWELRFDWRPSGYNPGYYFLVNIKKIPELKWENQG